MGQKYRRCCGIDVHKKSLAICVLPAVGKPEAEMRKRTFRTFTRDLRQLRTWLKNCKVTEIAMESTGQYWRPVWNILEGHFEKLILVNPQHIKGLAGRKTDPKDAQWIADLLEGGKLKGSLVPSREQRELRDVTRQRVKLLQDLNRVKNRIEQLCQSGNIKITSVASDLFGESGRTMLKALVEGRRDPGWMADYARGRLRSKRRELEAALEGSFTPTQRWLLSEGLMQVEWYESRIQVLEQEIERRMIPLAEAVRRIVTIPGIEQKTAWTIVAEVGADMSAFEDASHLASWAGLCPGNRESGGKRMPSRTRKANRYVRRAMCQAAWAASHSKNTFLSAFYRRMMMRKGEQKAVMALAHHMILIVYNILRRDEEYVEVGGDFYDRRNKAKAVSRMVSRLNRLGYQVSLTAAEADEVATMKPVFRPAIAGDVESEFKAELTLSEELEPRGSAAHRNLDSDLTAERSPGDVPMRRKRQPGRPCKCAERGIICKHKTGLRLNLLETQQLHRGEFS